MFAMSTPIHDGSITRAVGFGLVAAAFSGAIFFVFAGPLSFTAGLVVIAIALGRVVGLSVRGGAGTAIDTDARVGISLALTFVGLAAGLTATWLWALGQGGDLPIQEFLAQTYGLLVPLELVAAAGVAWYSAR